MQNRRYPKIFIRSKSEFAKHISHKNFTKEDALKLINDVKINFEKYWKDSKRSDPKKEKYVRNAKGTPLGMLLKKINSLILAPHDKILPNFIFGGLKDLNHAKAAKHLLGNKRKRTLLKLDIKHFFEQIGLGRVFIFFQNKCGCSKKASKLLSSLCCVSLGPKGSNNPIKTIARGFATSSRLAVWCNLDIFIALNKLIQKRLKGHDPRIAIYVDDIGITASRINKETMEKLYIEIKKLFYSFDKNQLLPLHDIKDKGGIITHNENMQILGLQLNRNTLSIGSKTRSKKNKLMNKLKISTDKKILKNKYMSLI